MSWADVKRRYEQRGTATQSTEDMTARRILRAMGLTEKTIWRAEREAGTENSRREDSTLLERVTRLAQAGYRGAERFFPPPTVRDVKNFREAEDTLMELVEAWKCVSRNYPVLVYRTKGSKDIRVLQSRGCSDVMCLDDIAFPCTLLKGRDGNTTIVDCDAGVYFDKLLGRKAEE